MIGAIVTVGFVGLLLFAGKVLFNAKDWGKVVPTTRRKTDFYERHGARIPLEYMDRR